MKKPVTKNPKMKNPVKRLILTLVLTAVFLGVYAAIMYCVGTWHYEDLIVIHNQRKTTYASSVLNQFTSADTYDNQEKANTDLVRQMDMLAENFGGELFLVAADAKEAERGQGRILYGTDGVRDFVTVTDLGIPFEDLKKEYFTLRLNGKDTYLCTPVKLGSGQYLVCCYSFSEAKAAFIGSIITQVLFAIVLLAGIITWCFSVIWMVSAKDLQEDQIRKYVPAAVKKRTVNLGAMAVLLVFLVALLTTSMQFMFEEDKTASTTLGLLGKQIEEVTQDAEDPSETIAVKQDIYRRMVPEGQIIIEIDPETQMIESCSRELFVGANAKMLGIKKESLTDCRMDFFRIDRRYYFGVSRIIGGKVFYYLTDNTQNLNIGAMFALLTASLFLIGCFLIVWFALKEYTDESYKEYSLSMRESSQKNREKLDQNTAPVSHLVRFVAELLPEQKTKLVLQAGIGLFMVILLLIALSDTPMAEYSALNFVIEGNWTRGINLFGIVAAITSISIEYLVFLILKVVFYILYGVLDAKGETAGRLLRSLFNYMLVIGGIFLVLKNLGVDTATLIASLGLFSLAFSLGAKDIIADVLAGISIVFEDTYNVGDFVEIDGFKGKVMEIGTRSTKLLGSTNAIKTINNHEISKVINLSKKSSFCSVSFTVKTSDSLGEIESMLARELPAWKEQIPGLISGPDYVGVTAIEDGSMTLNIVAEAKEENIYNVQLGLNRALQKLYERGLIVAPKNNTYITLNYGGE